MNAKVILQSKTIVGAVIMIVMLVYKIDVSQADVDAASSNVDTILQAGTALLGFVMVILGHIKTTKAMPPGVPLPPDANNSGK